jgi:hypothetical protein
MSKHWYNTNLAWPVEELPEPTVKSLQDVKRTTVFAEVSGDAPLIFDVRPDGHNSFSVVPKLGEGEYNRLQEFYKFEWLTTWGRDEATAGELYFGLYAIELKSGPAIVQPRVFDLAGNPADGVLVWFSWPGAQTLDPAAQPRYKQTGVHGWTDATGSCGWAYNQEGHIGENGGPFTAWCNSGEGPLGTIVGSDALDRIGSWDDHITPNPWFKVMRKGGDAPPPVGTGLRLVTVDAGGNELGYVNLTSGAPDNPEKGALVLKYENKEVAHVDWS